MHRENRPTLRSKELTGAVALLLTILATELAIHELLSPLFFRLSPVSDALVNACIATLLSAFPLWFFCVRRRPDEDASPGGEGGGTLLKVLIGIFTADYLVTLLLPYLFPFAGRVLSLADAALSAVLIGIIIWLYLARPRMRSRNVPVLDPTLRLYVLLLCTVFLSGLLQELLLPLLNPGAYLAPARVADALLTTVCGAPLVWLLVVQPLKREARSERARVAAVHEQVIDAIITLDPQGVITSCNRAAQRTFGYAPGRMVGGTAAMLLVDGQRGLDLLLAAVSAGDEPVAPSPFSEIRCRCRDGSTLIMTVSISEVLLEERRELLLIMRDITSRRAIEQALLESETRFREIFNQAEDAIVFFKPGGCEVIDVNANVETVFGCRKEDLLERGLELVSEADDYPALARAIAGIGEGTPGQHDFICRRGDRARIVVSMRGKIMLLQGMPVTYCTFRDVTERVRMEEKTREIQAKLIQANKMTSLGLLVSGVAHEINNPNNFIMANSQLLSRISRDSLKLLKEYSQEHGGDSARFRVAGIPFPELEEHWVRLLGGILDGSRRVNDIVNNLKRFARQERGDMSREVDVNQVARSAVTLMHHELIKFTENFHLDLAENLPPVTGHSQQLGQVIINLLMNACQALPGKERGVFLSTRCDRQRGEVVISVKDEGCGMSREQSQRIMEQFFTTKLESGGTGLGLSISESIMKEHGGRLEFVSEQGRGSTFLARIPVSPGDGSDAAQCGGDSVGRSAGLPPGA